MALTDKFEDLGPNSGLVEEMYRQFLENPGSVSASWRDFFADYAPRGAAPAPRHRDGPAPAPAARPRRDGAPRRAGHAEGEAAARRRGAPPVIDGETADPLRGSAARIVENMEASLQVPTATSVRTVAAKLLEVNRQILNNHLNRVGRGKVSFTHLIAFAIAQGRQADAGDELRLRRRRRQADGRAPRPPQPRHRGRRRAARRLALAARPEHQARRRARLRVVLRRVRRADPQGPHEQARARGLRRHDRARSRTPG